MRKFEITKAYKDYDILVPRRATAHSAGYDLASVEDVIIKPGEIKMVPTGLKALIPFNEVLLIYPRSSLGLKKGLMMSNGVGVIDADYYNNEHNEGHIMIPLYNFSNKDASIKSGERVAQGVFVNFQKTIDDDPNHEQRLGGFGSSDKKE
ncbi:MAG: dUTP diphosphatase [Acholeplasmataceae bacterium]|nr:dUTP diphosphatase [Acholeplasmataceae bacterium]